MRVYFGEPTGKMVEVVRREGIGAVFTPFRLVRPYPYKFRFFFYDNGAFVYWKRGEQFNGRKFLEGLERVLVSYSPQRPDFVVIPDLVARGEESLEFSLSWYKVLERDYPEIPLAFVVQDGMEFDKVKEILETLSKVKVLFVGGTIPWKVQTTPLWKRIARELNLKLHVGRVGTVRRLRWVRSIGVDSIDSSLPLFSKRKLRNFLKALKEPVIQSLF